MTYQQHINSLIRFNVGDLVEYVGFEWYIIATTIGTKSRTTQVGITLDVLSEIFLIPKASINKEIDHTFRDLLRVDVVNTKDPIKIIQKAGYQDSIQSNKCICSISQVVNGGCICGGK